MQKLFHRYCFVFLIIQGLLTPGRTITINEDLDQAQLLMPRHMMEIFVNSLSFPELLKLEMVNKGLLGLCSHALQYRILTGDWEPPHRIIVQYDLSNPRKKFLHMLQCMPEFQLKVAELWQSYFPLRLLAPAKVEIPNDYYWPRAHDLRSKTMIKSLYDRVLDGVKTHYCAERARAILGLSTLEIPQMGTWVHEIVCARKFRLFLNGGEVLRKQSVPAYETALRLRALSSYIPFYDSRNHMETLLKLTLAKHRVFPDEGKEQEDFQMEYARIGFCSLLGEMLFKSLGDNNLGLSYQNFNAISSSRFLPRDQHNHIQLRLLQIRFKEERIENTDLFIGLAHLVEDPYTTHADFLEIEEMANALK